MSNLTFFEVIINGLGQILGIEVIVFTMLTFAFLAFLYSRGLGITALIATFVFTAWTFTQDVYLGIPYLDIEIYIAIIIIFGIFIGYIVHQLFLRSN